MRAARASAAAMLARRASLAAIRPRRRGCAPRTDGSSRAARRSTAPRRCRPRARAARRRAAPARATAVDGCVPLMRARPSFGPSVDRRQARRVERVAARDGLGRRRRASLRPRRPARAPDARAARDRRSRRPSRATARADGRRRSAARSARRACRRRMPEKPFASTFARSAIVARTARAGSGSPTPAAWLRSRFSCSAPSASRGILTSANEPKPVLMP